MSYGIDPVPPWRRAASYVVRILRGSKAYGSAGRAGGNFRVGSQSKTAKALGVELPTSILLRADKVIE
jgi:putative ABC transport system substrate-binding protein